MRKTRRASMLLGALVVALAGCTKAVDSGGVEKKMARTLSAQVGQRVTVKCPEDLKAKKGRTYECTATAMDGSKMRLRLMMVDDSGHTSFRGAGVVR